MNKPLRLLVLTNLYPPLGVGGYEERCRVVVEGLRERGHQVQVLTSTYRAAEVSPESEVRRVLRLQGYLQEPWLPWRELLALERHNHQQLCEAIRDWNPEMVHVWNMGGLSKSLLVPLLQAARPCVLDISDHWLARSLRADVWLKAWNGEVGPAAMRPVLRLMLPRLLSLWGHQGWRWSEWKMPRLYFCSQFLRDLTAQSGLPVTHGAIIPCGIPTRRFAVRPPSQERRRLLWVGRLHPDKDPITAIEAVRQLRADGVDVTLHLYGRGTPEFTAQVMDVITRAGLKDQVQLQQARPEEMPEIYARHDLLLFTSQWGEPFALTPLEAMAAGLPVVAAADGGTPELIESGVNGLLVPPRDAAALAAAVRELGRDPDKTQAMAEAGRATVLAHYDAAQMVERIERYLLESRAPSGMSPL